MVSIDFNGDQMKHPFHDVPIRVEIAGQFLSGWNNEWQETTLGWGVIAPAPYMARWAYLELQRVRLRGFGGFEWPDSRPGLVFRMDDNDVLVGHMLSGIVVQLPYADLEKAWQDYAGRVRTFVTQRFPDFIKALTEDPLTIAEYVDHLKWDEWFKGICQDSEFLMPIKPTSRPYDEFNEQYDTGWHVIAREE